MTLKEIIDLKVIGNFKLSNNNNFNNDIDCCITHNIVRRNCSHIDPIPQVKLTTTSSSDKAPTPCKSEKQPQLKDETPVKPLPAPCLLSRPKRIIRPSLKLKERLGLC